MSVTKLIYIPKGGTFLETTEIPPWASTSSTVRLEHTTNSPPIPEDPVRQPPWAALLLLLLLLGFPRG